MGNPLTNPKDYSSWKGTDKTATPENLRDWETGGDAGPGPKGTADDKSIHGPKPSTQKERGDPESLVDFDDESYPNGWPSSKEYKRR